MIRVITFCLSPPIDTPEVIYPAGIILEESSNIPAQIPIYRLNLAICVIPN